MKGARESKRAKKKNTREARERYLATLTPDRRFIVELNDLMEDMWKDRHSIGYYLDKDDSEVWPLEDMLEALERHCEKVRSKIYYWRPDKKRLPEPKPPRTDGMHLVPLTEAQDIEWQQATHMEQIGFYIERYLFATIFKNRSEPSSRGRPSDPEVEFRSKRIAAYTQFREWEGHPLKAAIADAIARYKCSRAAVFAARKRWCPQMQHLRPHFDPATARERIEKFEDQNLVLLGLDKSSD